MAHQLLFETVSKLNTWLEKFNEIVQNYKKCFLKGSAQGPGCIKAVYSAILALTNKVEQVKGAIGQTRFNDSQINQIKEIDNVPGNEPGVWVIQLTAPQEIPDPIYHHMMILFSDDGEQFYIYQAFGDSQIDILPFVSPIQNYADWKTNLTSFVNSTSWNEQSRGNFWALCNNIDQTENLTEDQRNMGLRESDLLTPSLFCTTIMKFFREEDACPIQ